MRARQFEFTSGHQQIFLDPKSEALVCRWLGNNPKSVIPSVTLAKIFKPRARPRALGKSPEKNCKGEVRGFCTRAGKQGRQPRAPSGRGAADWPGPCLAFGPAQGPATSAISPRRQSHSPDGPVGRIRRMLVFFFGGVPPGLTQFVPSSAWLTGNALNHKGQGFRVYGPRSTNPLFPCAGDAPMARTNGPGNRECALRPRPLDAL